MNVELMLFDGALASKPGSPSMSSGAAALALAVLLAAHGLTLCRRCRRAGGKPLLVPVAPLLLHLRAPPLRRAKDIAVARRREVVRLTTGCVFVGLKDM